MEFAILGFDLLVIRGKRMGLEREWLANKYWLVKRRNLQVENKKRLPCSISPILQRALKSC